MKGAAGVQGKSLEGKVALVTGAARGIGADIAAEFARAGAKVVLSDLLEEQGEKTAAAIRSEGGRAEFIAHDVRDEDRWTAAIEKAVRDFGGLDIVVNNAGVEISGLVVETDAEACRRLFDINVTGVLLGMKHAFRAMRPGGASGQGGAILNLASVAALTSTPGLSAYSASKAAVDRLTRVAAVEAGRLGYGVRVNCLCPSLIRTEMGDQLAREFIALGLFTDADAVADLVVQQTPLGRWGEMRDVARAAVFLCSDAADFVTGVALPVDGGFSQA